MMKFAWEDEEMILKIKDEAKCRMSKYVVKCRRMMKFAWENEEMNMKIKDEQEMKIKDAFTDRSL